MKPLLLGMCNPLSDDPEFDLYPYPEGSAGWRLWRMLPEGTSRKQYLEAFDRRNILRAREWDAKVARAAGWALLPELRGRLVVVLGPQVRVALGLPPAEPLSVRVDTFPVGDGGLEFTWIAFPHPSGRNRWFNDPANRARSAEVLRQIFDVSAGVIRAEDFAVGNSWLEA